MHFLDARGRAQQTTRLRKIKYGLIQFWVYIIDDYIASRGVPMDDDLSHSIPGNTKMGMESKL
jgi:hypothetical protein